MSRVFWVVSLISVAAAASTLAQPKQTREQKVLDDRKKIEAEGFWIYNDLKKGFAEAKKTGKPMLVIFRCIPCVECVKLDDDLVNQDQRVRPLLDKFVRVRVVSTNGLDLSLFQYDFDQSFAAFMLNADGAIYGRFGTRSHRTSWADDVSVEGLANALQGALDLHSHYPANKETLAGKKGPAPDVAAPELYPTLKGKYGATITYENNVVQSCIHCHQIGEAQKALYRSKREAIPENLLFPYPHPKSQGLILDPKERATVTRVDKGSSAEQAGFQAGDRIAALAGQPLLSMADAQWILHQAPAEGATLAVEVAREGKPMSLKWKLPAGWKSRDDLSWRASTWALRRMGTGGMIVESATAEERQNAKIADGSMGLRVKFVGQFGAHAVAKAAGIRANDLVVSFDGQTNLARESDLIAYAVTKRKPGEKVEVKWLRNGKEMKASILMQE